MRLLVTGVAGLCGTHLVNELVVKENVEMIFGIDNFSRGYPCREQYEIPEDWKPKFHLIAKRYQDVSIKELNNLNVDVVVHLAAFNSSNESMETPGEYFVNNDYGTLKLLQKLLHTKKTPLFLFASTVEVYGKPSKQPVTEEFPLSCLNLFSATKLAGESYCSAFYHWYNYPTIVIRLTNIYGEWENIFGYSTLVGDFISKALLDEPLIIYGCGNQLRDFLYAGDAAKAIVKVIEHGKAALGQVMNLGSGKPVSIEELANKIAAISGRNSGIIKVPAEKGDYPGFHIDLSKARSLVGWEPSINLEQGLSRTIEWHKKINKLTI